MNRFITGRYIRWMIWGVLAWGGSGCAQNPERDSWGNEITGCAGADSKPAHPFGAHDFEISDDAILPDQWSQDELDDHVREFYDKWRKEFIKPGCEDGHYLLATKFGATITVSEAHGYGMVILAYMAGHDPDAKKYFDGMYHYFVAHPSSSSDYLMAWSQDKECINNDGDDSASDGDIDIAYALLLADKQWGSDGEINYRREAARVIREILNKEVDDSDSYVLLGDWATPGSVQYYDATRSSDFMPGHFESFESFTKEGDWGKSGRWTKVVDKTYEIFDSLQREHAVDTGLIPDFIVRPLSNPAPVDGMLLEREVDGSYSYNACRVPMRIGMHYLTSGDKRAKKVLDRINKWLREEADDDPMKIMSGYHLDGEAFTDYQSFSFIAPFAVGAVVDEKNQDWLNTLWQEMKKTEMWGYFDDTLKMMSMIALSGNWWAPESASCPDD